MEVEGRRVEETEWVDYDGKSKTEVLRSKGSGSVQVWREKVPEPDWTPKKVWGSAWDPNQVRFGVWKKWPPNRTKPDPGIPRSRGPEY